MILFPIMSITYAEEENVNKKYVFTGDSSKRPGNPHPDSPHEPEPYIASEELKQAVNLAIYLRRPLLLEGEAGCGKTRLAHALAYELGLPFYRWDVRSTSKAQEGLYSYDSILRLHDVQISQFETKQGSQAIAPAGTLRDPLDPESYRTFGPLGKAFILRDCPAVVLIDEIDKADIDFPNDLLAVLDDPWEFEIPETGETGDAKIKAAHKPIVIITSNKEKGNLPAPFLRRCLYHFIEFPDNERLEKIVDRHYHIKGDKQPLSTLVTSAIERFQNLRSEGGLHKKPGTSEFLDWIEALQNFGSGPYKPSQVADMNSALPYPELVLKLRADWQRHVKSL